MLYRYLLSGAGICDNVVSNDVTITSALCIWQKIYSKYYHTKYYLSKM